MTPRTIYLRPDAPPKPDAGAACNGCGVCCVAEPCPLGVLLSASRSGACKVLRWDDAAQSYRCGAVVDANAVLRERLPVGVRWMAGGVAWAVRLGAKRWIAAGTGCDCSLEASASGSNK